ncbi:hypothetical protein I551_2584 [Mycobacterium ulcerans str. Harvey]|uniref:Dephospho-CoA kinase n=1 Tax=Mycobacterium ulcerans str. Harvey TaxID=1299332 RepID=A0ABN0R155_MYCUL|nr:hypothetical protein I551_2584 [Mycobacterium ulcerans str. Harvey]
MESGMAPLFPLVVVVHADMEVRLRRLVHQRGMSEDDACARIAAQASDEQRRAVADVWLDNSGSLDALVERARDVWNNRILPFAHNLSVGQIARFPARVVPADPSWPEQAQRIVARLKTTCGHKASRVDHIGSTAVAGFDAKDVIDIQVTVESLAVADELAEGCARPVIRALSTSPRTTPKKTRAASSTTTTTVVTLRCGISVFMPPRTQADRRMCTFGWMAGPISSSPCCSWTGCGPIPGPAPIIWPSSATQKSRRRSLAAAWSITSPQRSPGFSTPTGGHGSGPTRPDGGRSRSGGAPRGFAVWDALLRFHATGWRPSPMWCRSVGGRE